MKYFWGSDTYAAREAIAEFAQQKNAEITWLDPEDVKKDPAVLRTQTAGLFGNKVSVLRDPSSLAASVREGIAEHAENLPDSVVLWDRVKPDKRSKLWKSVRKQAQEFSEVSPDEIAAWLQEEIKKENGQVERSAATLLAERLGKDRWLILNEAKRLVLLAEDGHVTRRLVEENVKATDSAEIFPTLDALLAGNAGLAIKNIEILLAAGESEFYVLTMLAYQFRTLLMIKRGDTAGLHDFVVRKGSTVAAKFSDAELVGALTKIMGTDVAIKQGKTDSRTGLLLLVASLVKR